MKMGRRLHCSSVTYPFRYAPSSRLAGGPFSSQRRYTSHGLGALVILASLDYRASRSENTDVFRFIAFNRYKVVRTDYSYSGYLLNSNLVARSVYDKLSTLAVDTDNV